MDCGIQIGYHFIFLPPFQKGATFVGCYEEVRGELHDDHQEDQVRRGLGTLNHQQIQQTIRRKGLFLFIAFSELKSSVSDPWPDPDPLQETLIQIIITKIIIFFLNHLFFII